MMKHRKSRAWPRSRAALLLCALLPACALHHPKAPDAPAPPPQYKEAYALADSQASTPDAWWTLFRDPVLDDLEQRLLIGNENLKGSVAQVAVARALLRVSQGANEPTLGLNLSASRANAATQPSAQIPLNTVSLGASSSWEIDVWGRLSAATENAQASYDASQADLAAARLSAQATLAQTYFSLRTAEAQGALQERSVQAYERALELTQARYAGGLAGLSDVLQAQTQLGNARTQLSDTAAQRAQLEHALAVLVGDAPARFAVASTSALPDAVSVPASLPSTLLQRRPDLRAAQRRVVAAYAQIGVADAAQLPALSLTASAGFSQNSFANLLNTPNVFWSLGSSLAQTIFDGNALAQASVQARANADLAMANYRQQVLTALQEVEDNLALTSRLAEELQSQSAAVQAAQRNLDITLEQYRSGTVSYLNVVTAQTTAWTSESTLLTLRNRQLSAVNVLLKNLAGRWDAEPAKP